MRRAVLFLLVPAVLAAAAACGPQAKTPVVKPTPAAVPTPAEASTETVASPAEMQAQVEDLRSEIDLLKLRADELEPHPAHVSTEEMVYGVAQTQFGAFTVKAMGVTPYLDGFKVKLAIGNLTSATFHGVKLKVTWGPLMPGSAPARMRAFKAPKDHAFDLTTVLRPGADTNAEVSLTPAKPEEVKFIAVGLELNEMSLRR